MAGAGVLLALDGQAGATEAALHRGVNLSSWLANAPRQPVYARDMALIRQAGFDHVRLPFNPEYYGFRLTPEADPAALDFTALDRAVAMAAQNDLPVMIDLHPSGDFVETLERHAWAEDKYVALWVAIARHYRSRSGDIVLFELLNEPQYYKSEDVWNRLAARLTAAIRAVSPDRDIVIGAPHGSEIDGLPFLRTGTDAHILYSFHFYEPYLITHQGIHMGFEGKAIRYARALPYPSALATGRAADYAPGDPDIAGAGREIDAYRGRPWNAATIAARVDIARDWAAVHHVRLLCGEFGVLRNHIDPASRYRWIGDARAAFDRDGIGWEIWDYGDLFGITRMIGATSTDPVDGSVRFTDPDRGEREFEPAALAALDLADGAPRVAETVAR